APVQSALVRQPFLCSPEQFPQKLLLASTAAKLLGAVLTAKGFGTVASFTPSNAGWGEHCSVMAPSGAEHPPTAPAPTHDDPPGQGGLVAAPHVIALPLAIATRPPVKHSPVHCPVPAPPVGLLQTGHGAAEPQSGAEPADPTVVLVR